MENCLSVFRETINEELRAHQENEPLIKYGNFLESMVIECKLFLPWGIKRYELIYYLISTYIIRLIIRFFFII